MAASCELILTIFICIHSTLNQVVGAVEQNVLLPQLTTEGSIVAKLPWETGQKSEIVSLLGSDLFHIKDGKVITTKDISKLIHQTLPLVIRHELGTRKWFDTLHVKITNTSSADSDDRGPSFSSCEYAVTVDYADAVSEGIILSIPATYTHGSTIRYVLKPDDVFDVDNNGNVFVKTPSTIFAQEYVLELVAVDSEDRTSIPVRITVTVTSDLKFKSRHHRVRRQVQQSVAVSVAESETTAYTFEDRQDTPFYQIVNSTVPGLFQMSSRSIITASGRRMDYEQEDQREISVTVDITVANEVIETRTVRISVLNVNDENPYFIMKPQPYLARVSSIATEGETVFTLMAQDPDGPLADIEYYLLSGAEGRFSVDLNTGEIKVVGSTAFERNKEYFVNVDARDVGADPIQRTPQKAVQIWVGERAPQIFEPRYVRNVPEEANAPYLVVPIKARSFQSADLRYTLQNNVGSLPSAFTITPVGPQAGEVKLMQTLDYESQTQPKEYRFRVIVSELSSSSSLSSTAQLIVHVTDINDHDPKFPLSTYIKRNVREDTQIGVPLLNVTAVDLDSGRNAELTFSVSDPLFDADTIGNTGIIKVNGRLDYDRKPERRYQFQVFATDNGASPLSGSASVIVLVTNVNDEDPEFSTDLKAEVLENAKADQFVHTVHVTDPDGDGVKVYFKNPNNGAQAVRNGPFQITPETGRVFLWQALPRGTQHYVLNLTAEDDGLCCGPPIARRQSEAALIVEVMDINDNRPEFQNCTNYQSTPPSVKENSPLGSSVFQVHAVDEDKGENGRIRYDFLVATNENKFRINSTSGLITVVQQIDREARDGARDIGITVQASDHGNPQLNGICSFRILVEDVNDNKPKFTRSTYQATLVQNSRADTSVERVVANDEDSGENRRVEYSLIENPSNLFKINSETGVIRLAVDLGDIRTQQVIVVMAQDHGSPTRLNSTANVVVDVKTNLVRPPQWQGSVANNVPIHINETHSTTHTNPIARLQATRDDGGPVDFLFITNDQLAVAEIDPFAIYRPPNQIDMIHIFLINSLDFERTESYELKIRAAGGGANSDIIVTVAVEDQNDEAPVFRGYNPIALTINGSLTENREPPQTVVTLQAIDADKTEAFRRLRYSFLEGQNPDVARNFSIDDKTGVITTKTKFDLEAIPQGVIRFTVKVDDRVPSVDPTVPNDNPNSATATVEVVVLDVNDNEPHFTQSSWNASVLEDVDIGHPVLTVSAQDQDKDSQMEFSIISAGNDFTVEPRSGIVRVANLLDFDDSNRRRYNLTIQVYDGTFTDTAQLVIQVLDANDNDPVFDENPYTVLNITEESDDVPKVMITVRATDPDTERPNDIEYSLNGPLAEDGTFAIDRKTGVISLQRRLDRDYPDGQEVFEFNILAVDEPGDPNKRTGVSYVRVLPIDINDNAPQFDQGLISGSVLEHTTGAGTGNRVFAVNAVDYDAGENARVEYSIIANAQHQGNPIFGIDSTSGQIYVSVLDESVLDRETKDKYILTIQAKDKGTPEPKSNTQNITIHLSDKNDQIPVFSQNIYKVTMSENYPEGTSIISVKASDQDEGVNAQLIYSLESPEDTGYFYIETRNKTNEGILRVFEPNKIDYENPATQSFNVTVSVDDVPSPIHKVLAYIEVTVEDFNDNAPEFEQKSFQKSVFENITVGTSLATFTAKDVDSGINKMFDYFIDHRPGSDPRRQFTINQDGLVQVNKELDRETDASHEVKILAIDKGTPQQTGTATLLITVKDVNDNAPRFAEDYVVYFEEEETAVQSWPQDIRAVDDDLPQNGPPFTFYLPCDNSNACPCPDNPTCDLFRMEFSRATPGGDGFARVSTFLVRFDREEQKEYRMPIVMTDSGIPQQTGTNMLRIVIKDKNDNEHSPALKEIFVYSYEGFRPLEKQEIGRVYAKDEDDWDIVDKEFTVVGDIDKYFEVDKASGMVLLSGKPPENEYAFKVAVYDRTFDMSHDSEVRVTVKAIPAKAVYSSGSIRLSGISARDFMERPHAASGEYGKYDKSAYDKMKTELAERLGTAESNVDIFSVRDNQGFTDVRFAAHGSPWYKPSKLNGVIITNKAEFQENVGVTVGMVPIDECLHENNDHGCHNVYRVLDTPRIVYGNTTSFMGVDAFYVAEYDTCNETSAASCTCLTSQFPTECRSDFCYNEGTCYIDDWMEMRCKCKEEFDGPRCQQTKHSFPENSWALYPALAQCEFGRTSLEFITQQANGLLFYNGGMEASEVKDYIALQLKNGAPVLDIDHGTGTLSLTVPNVDLADNEWHRIDITSEGKEITLTVDNCRTAVITENERASVEDRTSCEASDMTPGENMFLNVNSPLQMGGTVSDPLYLKPIPPSFNGCIKNFKHLGMLYDLHIGTTGLHSGTKEGCPQETESCGSENDVNGLICGENGICEGKLGGAAPVCRCKPGWMGNRCSQETPTKDFRDNSYLVWNLLYDPLPERTNMQLNFRSRDKDGVLFAVMSVSREQFLQLEIRDYTLQLAYHLGSGVRQSLRLDKVNASNGHWHTVYMERAGKRIQLYLDSGEGPYYTETKGLSSGHRLLNIAADKVFGGALVTGDVIQDPETTDYESSCMSDVRLDGRWLPMDKGANSNAAEVVDLQNLENGCDRDDCAANDCSPDFICVPLWERYTCKCKPGFAEVNSTCVSICRCFNGGTCIYPPNAVNGFACNCPREYTGLQCETKVASLVRSAALSIEGLAAILVCFFLLLLLVLAVFLYIKMRKPKEKMILDDDPYDDIRENIVNYDEDGAGEEDQNAFDISRIRVPLDGAPGKKMPFEEAPRRVDRPLQSSLPPGETPDVGNFIEGRLKDADEDLGAPPHDSVREFAHEGGGSDAGSLSSLNTSTSSGDQDYDYLNDWGPKFAKLADMYGAGHPAEDD